MRKLLIALSASVIALFCNALQAEIYKDFVPFITLKQVRLNYPNAKFEDTKPAWASEDEALFTMTGEGLAGTIVLKFSKPDKYNNEKIAEYEKDILSATQENVQTIQSIIENYKSKLALPLEEKLTLDWVRFVPTAEIPYERLVSRYGKAEKCDYDQNTFKPYCSWLSKGITVSLSDNKKMVDTVEYSFTFEEMFPAPKPQAKPSLKKKSPKPKGKKEPALL